VFGILHGLKIVKFHRTAFETVRNLEGFQNCEISQNCISDRVWNLEESQNCEISQNCISDRVWNLEGSQNCEITQNCISDCSVLAIVYRCIVKMQHDFPFMDFPAVRGLDFHERLNETSDDVCAIHFVSLRKNRDLALTSSLENDYDHRLLLEV
jgi:hypothetical protein